jgi:nicotinamide phosphoribosyltransferase
MMIAPINQTDSYKFPHFQQYLPGTQYVSSYIESRGVELGKTWKDMVFAGMQYYLSEFLSQPLVTEASLKRAARRVPQHGVTFNEDGFRLLLNRYGGFMPLRVQALPEGLVVPLKTPLVQVVNTDPDFYWLTSFVETKLLRIWYPCTVATLSMQIKRTIKAFMQNTAGHSDGLEFMLHDFGSRGVSSSESAVIGGLSHLYNFRGSDTFEAVEAADWLFNAPMAAYSVDAAEHSTITSFGPNKEKEAFEHLLSIYGDTPNKIFSVVSDTYDIYNACANLWGGTFRPQVQALGEQNARLVVRPDSGDPTTVPIECIQILMDKFGYTVNKKGYKVLPPYIRVIQGDGINEASIKTILWNMKMHGLSAENIVFGMGGALLQQVNRDTLKFAMKASAMKNPQVNDGEWYDVFKKPKSDPGKSSKRGRLAVIYEGGEYKTINEADLGDSEDLLETVYDNGKVTRTTSLEKIRERVNEAL